MPECRLALGGPCLSGIGVWVCVWGGVGRGILIPFLLSGRGFDLELACQFMVFPYSTLFCNLNSLVSRPSSFALIQFSLSLVCEYL